MDPLTETGPSVESHLAWGIKRRLVTVKYLKRTKRRLVRLSRDNESGGCCRGKRASLSSRLREWLRLIGRSVFRLPRGKFVEMGDAGDGLRPTHKTKVLSNNPEIIHRRNSYLDKYTSWKVKEAAPLLTAQVSERRIVSPPG